MRNTARMLANIYAYNIYGNNFNKIIDRLYNSNKSYDVCSFGEKYINSKKYKRVKKNKRKSK